MLLGSQPTCETCLEVKRGVDSGRESPPALLDTKAEELRHSLEPTGGSDVGFGQFRGLFLVFLVFLSFAVQDRRRGG